MPSLPPIRPEDEARARRTGPDGHGFDAPVDEHGPARVEFLLRLGDDSLVLSQRLSEWAGRAPTVEVDLSLANMALDLIGQATHFLEHAGRLEGRGRDGDRLAFHRDVLDFRNCLLVEQPNGDFAQTMARQFLFSTWQKLLFENAHLVFENGRRSKVVEDGKDKKIEHLEAKLQRKNEVMAELMEAHTLLKKELGEI